MNTITRFALRFAALLALTLAVLASVSVKASREPLAVGNQPGQMEGSAAPTALGKAHLDPPPG